MKILAKEMMMMALQNMPLVGTAMNIIQGIHNRYESVKMKNRLSDVENKLTSFEQKMQSLVRGELEVFLERLREPNLNGKKLTEEINNLRMIQENGWHSGLFEGLLQHSSHWQELLTHPQNYGKIIAGSQEVDSTAIHVFIDRDKTQILELTPFALHALLVNQQQVAPKAEIIAAHDIWALPQSENEIIDCSEITQVLPVNKIQNKVSSNTFYSIGQPSLPQIVESKDLSHAQNKIQPSSYSFTKEMLQIYDENKIRVLHEVLQKPNIDFSIYARKIIHKINYPQTVESKCYKQFLHSFCKAAIEKHQILLNVPYQEYSGYLFTPEMLSTYDDKKIKILHDVLTKIGIDFSIYTEKITKKINYPEKIDKNHQKFLEAFCKIAEQHQALSQYSFTQQMLQTYDAKKIKVLHDVLQENVDFSIYVEKITKKINYPKAIDKKHERAFLHAFCNAAIQEHKILLDL